MEKLNKIISQKLIIACLAISIFLFFSNWSIAQDTIKRQNRINPMDPEQVIDDIVPKPGFLFDIGVPQNYFDWKDEVYNKTGLKFGVSYQLLTQAASTVAPDAIYDKAVGQWTGFMIKWTLINRNKKNKGSLVFSMFDRRGLGNNAVPSNFGIVDIGGITTNVEFTNWNFAIENLYWEQWIGLGERDVMFRIGNQVATVIIDPFRFKDSRVSFTTGPFAFHPTMPTPTFGFGAAFKWLPAKGSGLYISGTLNDMNGDPNLQGFDWSTVSRGEFFYAGEVGYNWVRGKDDYDHLSLLVFYADERSTRSPETLPNKAGGGFSILGEKQWGNWVGFAKYTYNTAQGGGVTGTLSNHTVTAGAVYKNLLNVNGETGVGFYYMNPIDEIFGEEARDQTGIEAYWRISLTRNIWVTPGIQFVFNPTLNPEDDFVAIPHIKFRVAI
ncbi:MAG: carbohydrate porin [Eudoraea sp.]|uniref:carbohydrate porin n=1 Tax=Eudoraea sp. TaxID=1979955 RepID=UPI003265C2E3